MESLVLKILSFFSLFVFLGIQHFFPQAPFLQSLSFDFNERQPAFSMQAIRAGTFGYERAITTLQWLRFLQATPTTKVPEGRLSWIYFDLDTISRIDPEFLPVFESAAIFLSVVTEDKIGAELLLKRGVELYPRNWKIRANLAYHYRFELNNEQRAYEQYYEMAKVPESPDIYKILAASGMAETQSIPVAIAFLKKQVALASDPNVKARLQERVEHWEKKWREKK